MGSDILLRLWCDLQSALLWQWSAYPWEFLASSFLLFPPSPSPPPSPSFPPPPLPLPPLPLLWSHLAPLPLYVWMEHCSRWLNQQVQVSTFFRWKTWLQKRVNRGTHIWSGNLFEVHKTGLWPRVLEKSCIPNIFRVWERIMSNKSSLEGYAVIIEILQSLNESSSSEPLQSFHQRIRGIGWKLRLPLAFIYSPLLLLLLNYINQFSIKRIQQQFSSLKNSVFDFT